MNVFLLVLLLGLANHLATMIVVESEITRESRTWVERRAIIAAGEAVPELGRAGRRERFWAKFWHKVDYLHSCHLCAGTWVGLTMAAFVPPVVSSGVVGWVLTGLAIKGTSHMVLVLHNLGEARTREHEAYAKEPHAVENDESFRRHRLGTWPAGTWATKAGFEAERRGMWPTQSPRPDRHDMFRPDQEHEGGL